MLAAHNGAEFVDQQVHSILSQTVAPVELLVGDDASTDDTVQIVERIVASHPRGNRIRIIRRGTALGVVGNFEDLLRQTTSDFVALADQDDLWVPTRMESLLARFAAERGLLLLHHDAELIDAQGASLGGLFESLRIGTDALDDERQGRGFERLLRRNLVTGATSVLRRELLSLAGPVPPGWIHDEWLAIAASAHDGLGVDTRRLVYYRQHEGNQIGARRLDLRTVGRRFAEDGVDRNLRLLARARSLVDALDRLPGVAEYRRRLARDKLLHESRRSDYPISRLRRVVPVFAEWRSGRYTAFGNGAPDVIRDLLQPRRAGQS